MKHFSSAFFFFTVKQSNGTRALPKLYVLFQPTVNRNTNLLHTVGNKYRICNIVALKV